MNWIGDHSNRHSNRKRLAQKPARARRSFALVEVTVALAILILVVIPMAFALWDEVRLTRAYYQRAVAIEIVDGEMETLLAGHWRQFPPGTHPYPVTVPAATNLPPGEFLLTLQPDRIRLEWRPKPGSSGSPIVREVKRP